MAHGSTIWTFVDGGWVEGNAPMLASCDHAAWNASLVFDGARQHRGVTPDLDLHCARLNRSAEALALKPMHAPEETAEIIYAGLRKFAPEASVYIRPMFWSVEGGGGFIDVDPDSTAFGVGLEEIPMPPEDRTQRLTTTRFCRPLPTMAPVEAKAACLYANNARMMREARQKGFDNALVADPVGNVAETATSNIFMVRDGVVMTPIPNGTFLDGITRQRHMGLLRDDGYEVREATLTFDDFRRADEVFMSGNLAKVTPVTEFDGVHYQVGPVTRRARALYWDWALSA